jgi:hypothetical protein
VTVRVPVRDAYLIVNRDTTDSSAFVKLNMADGTLTIDDGWAPRIQASIVINRPSLAVQAQLDPTLPYSRVRFVLQAARGAAVRRIDLKITARQIDAEAGTIGLNLQSDECLLQDFGLVASAPDKTYWANQDNVRSILYNVMNRALGPGMFSLSYETFSNPSFRTYSAVENMIPNGSFDNNTVTPWTVANATLTASTGYKVSGAYSMLVNPNTTSNDSYAEVPIQVTPGKTYTVTAYAGVSGAQPGTLNARARRIWVYAYVDGQVVVLGQSSQAPNSSSSTRLRLTFTVPSNVEQANVRLYSGAASGTSAGIYWDSVMMTEDNGLDTNNASFYTYFDGATANTSEYRYDWTGDSYKSSSTRTPLIDRGPDALTWTPGQSAWDFLTPILQAVGWRLVPDLLDRTWRVKSVDAVPAGGVVGISVGRNLYSLSDLISRTASQSDGTPLFADAVLIHYTWTDSTTDERLERWESAGPSTAQKVYSIERPDTAYPGPGAAAYILERLAARRRQLTVEAAEDYDPMPGRAVSITAPGGDVVTGVLDALTWDFGSARMSVKTKGLISIPAGAVGRAPSTQTVGSVLSDLASYTN